MSLASQFTIQLGGTVWGSEKGIYVYTVANTKEAILTKLCVIPFLFAFLWYVVRKWANFRKVVFNFHYYSG